MLPKITIAMSTQVIATPEEMEIAPTWVGHLLAGVVVGVELDAERVTAMLDHLPNWPTSLGLVAHFAFGALVG